MNKKTLAAMVAPLVVFSALSFAQQSGVTKDQIVGSWNLASVELVQEGKKQQPFGPSPKGYLSIDRNGTYAMLLFRPGTPPFAKRGRLSGTDAENKAVVHNSQAYYGTYKLKEKDGLLEIRVDQSTYPNHDGTDQRRMIRVAGDELVIANPDTPGGGSAQLVFKRIK